MRFKKQGKALVAVLAAGILMVNTFSPVVAMAKDNTKVTGHGKEVKNVIIMISDGWGYNQIMATDYYNDGKVGTQAYEKFPAKLAMGTYSYGSISKDDDGLSYYDPLTIWDDFNSLKNYATDSAAAGTAMSTGSKTYDAAIGVDQDLKALKHLSEDFEDLGRATGVVTTVEFSHATPATFVAHHSNRNDYSILANQMIMDSATDVIIGAGNPYYNDNGELISFEGMSSSQIDGRFKYVGGQSTWEGLLNGTLSVSDADGDGMADPWTLIQAKDDFEALTEGETPNRLIGVPQVYTTLQQARSGDTYADAFEVDFNDNVPDLATMTKVALNVLDNDEDGLFLMVEGGAVDWTGHANQSGRLIEEQTDFNNAVKAVCQWVKENSSWSETLVIITGDHETGYLTGTLGVYDEVKNNGKDVMPTMAWNSGSHTNQLIPFFAKGCGAEIFKKLANETDPVRGKYLDNTEIALAIRTLID